MANKNYKWRWKDDPVDLQKEYIEIAYEDDPDSNAGFSLSGVVRYEN